MRKKLYLGLITAAVIAAATACGEESAETSEAVETSMEESSEETEESTEQVLSAGEEGLKELRMGIGVYAETAISEIEKDFEEVKAKLGDTYETYAENETVLTDWYSDMLGKSETAFSSINEKAFEYYSLVPKQIDTSDSDAVDRAMDDFYDDIYDDVMNEFYDRIYDGLLDEAYDTYYDGVLDEAYDSLDFSTWSDERSKCFGDWSDARGDFFGLWSDARGELFGNWSDVNGEFWSGNFDVDDILGAGFMGEVKEAMGEETTEEETKPETITVAETTEAETTVPETEAVEQNITAENNSDFKALIEDKEPSGDMQKAFVDKYEGQTIEFDGNIAFISNHGDYSTRYDVLVYAGDYSEVSVSGPAFQFNDVGVTELTGELFLPDYVKMGSNVHIIATVDDYNEGSGLLLLRPKSIEQR